MRDGSIRTKYLLGREVRGDARWKAGMQVDLNQEVGKDGQRGNQRGRQKCRYR